MLLSEIEPHKENIYLSDNDTVSAIQHSTDRSWMLTDRWVDLLEVYLVA